MADSLQQQLKRIHDNEDLLQSVLANMTGGIVMVDASGAIALINREAERILHVKGYQLLGRPYRDIKRNYEFTKFVEEGISRQENVQEERNVYDPEEKYCCSTACRCSRITGNTGGCCFCSGM